MEHMQVMFLDFTFFHICIEVSIKHGEILTYSATNRFSLSLCQLINN